MKHTLMIGMITAAFVHGVSFAQSDVNKDPRARESTVLKEMSRKEAHLAAPVRSERDLYWHLTTSSDSPLNLLPASSRWEFIGSLVFTDKGLASYRYDILEKELKQTGIYEVLSLFGVQHTARMLESKRSQTKEAELIRRSSPLSYGSCPPSTTPSDPACPGEIEDYRCAPPATCVQDANAICITRNCR